MPEKSVALVTGAARGIGCQICFELAGKGHDVVGVDVIFDPEDSRSGLPEITKKIEGSGARFLPIQGDISSLEDQGKICDLALSAFGKIDVLVNNAGVAPERRLDVLETTPQSYDRVMAVNARGAFFLTQKVACLMIDRIQKEQDYFPCIVFISSISAEVSSPSRAEYCISKAALSHTARIYADRLSEHGIPVFDVRPGIVKTDMTVSVQDKYDRLIAEGLIPQQRWGYPEDVAKAVAALVSGSFSYSTGMVIEVSGGMNIRRL